MKTIKFLLLGLIASLSSYAQDPQLFENNWYLQKVIIDEVEHLPPFSNVIGRLDFSLDVIEIWNPFCEEGFSSFIDYIPANNFNIPDGGNILVGTCSNPDIIEYGNYHFSIYHDLDNFIAKNPFTYSLATENGIIILTIVNTDGDQAIYGNELLANPDFNTASIAIYPNPGKDELFIATISELTNFNVMIFNINGKQVLSLNDNNLKNKPIDVQKLTSGIYFIMIKDKQGKRAIKKFIKN